MALTIRANCPSSSQPTVLRQGHAPIEALFLEGEWSFFVDATEAGLGRFLPDEAVYHLTEVNQYSIPASPQFAFLGDPGNPVWIVSHIETPGSILLGISGERIPKGTFAGDRLNLKLTGVEGPGDFALYSASATGQVTIFHNSRDGITEADVILVAIGTHDHQNWAFNAPGHFKLTFQFSATLAASNETISSPEVSYYFAVGDVDPIPPASPVVLTEGDTDIAAVIEGGELILKVFSEELDQGFSHDCAVFRATPAARIAAPSDPAFAFLGPPGSAAWILPQTEEEGKLFLALAAEDIPTGLFEGDVLGISLLEFEGPGDFFLYQTDVFGQPVFYFNTSDGLSEQDHRILSAGEHYHMNWAFTAPGVYTLGLQASGVLASTGEPLTSSITHFTFEIATVENPRLAVFRKNAQTLVLSWNSQPDATDQLQSRASLEAGSWINEAEALPGIEGTHSVEMPIPPGQTTRFFRLLRF
jgi:surface-anchored protein